MAQPLCLLIVEDSEDATILIVRECRRAGYAPIFERVETAAEMEAALDRQTWDIVLSDHNLPHFNALSALNILRERNSDLPFIIVSGCIGEEVVAAAMKSGAYDYVMKDHLFRLVPALDRAMRDAMAWRERKRSEIALRESEERYALAVQGSRDGLWDWNLVTGHVYYSSRFKGMLDVEEHEYTDVIESFIDRVHDDDRDMVWGAIRDHIERHVPYDVEFRLRRRLGEGGWFCSRGQAIWDQEGKATRMAGSISDITTRKLTEIMLKEKLAIIQEQQEVIQLLSMPIIEVWDGVLTMPLLGTIDGRRAQQMMDVLLKAVVRNRCRYTIIDLTGVDTIDIQSSDHIVKLVEAVQLVGARCIVVGIRPEVAQTMVSIGIDFSRIMTLANLREALALCMRDRHPGIR